MGKHNLELPPTVEELAAQERARRRARLTRPGTVAAAAAAVAAIGATAWAFSRPDAPATVVAPDPVPSARASAAEGFGQAVPPSSAAPSAARPSSNAPSRGAPSPPTARALSALTASYVMSAWREAYKLEFTLTNGSNAAALWTVRLEIPSGARLDQAWNAEVTQESATVLLLRPPRWDGGNPRPVPAGGRFEFGLIVQGGQTVVSCTLDGSPCLAAG